MPENLSLRLEACFTDSRPPLEVKYDVERRVGRLLPRDLERPAGLFFRDRSQSVTVTGGVNTIELRLEAAFDTYNLYALKLDFEGPGDLRNEQTPTENLRRTMDRWTRGLKRSESRVGCSEERFRRVVNDTIASERALAGLGPTKEDQEGIERIQLAIVSGLREGKSFATAHKEGGTNIRWLGSRFVFQDYGESDDREESTSESDFLARLRQFYDWDTRKAWYPHAPPEIEAWRTIEGKLS